MNTSNNYKKNALKGVKCILLYIFIDVIAFTLLQALNIDYYSLNIHLKVIYTFLVEIITMICIILVLNKKIARDIQDMKKNYKDYFKKYFKYYLLSIIVMVVSNLIILLIKADNSIAGNEQYLRDLFKVAPIYLYVSSVFITPITEELVFRQSIRNLIPNKKLFIFVSALIFGTLHILTGFSSALDLLYLIPYSAPAFAFAYILADSDNICISTSLHCIHNGFIMSIQILALVITVII